MNLLAPRLSLCSACWGRVHRTPVASFRPDRALFPSDATTEGQPDVIGRVPYDVIGRCDVTGPQKGRRPLRVCDWSIMGVIGRPRMTRATQIQRASRGRTGPPKDIRGVT